MIKETISCLLLILGLSFEGFDDICIVQNPKQVKELLTTAIKNDIFLKKFTDFKELGAGSHGTVFKATYDKGNANIDVAIKIILDVQVQEIVKKPSREIIEMADVDFIDINKNLKPILFFREQGTPFIQEYISLRQFVSKNDYYNTVSTIPAENTDSTCKTTIKTGDPTLSSQLFIMDIANSGTLMDLAKSFANSDQLKDEATESRLKVEKIRLVKEMTYKGLVPLREIYLNKFINGDVKPENVFVNKQGSFKKLFYPVIGDWDLATFFGKKDQTESHLKYTFAYRPIEIFHNQISWAEVSRSNFTFNYNGSEDLYAYGASLVEFIKALGLTLEDIPEIKELIKKMVYPADIEFIKSFNDKGKNVNEKLRVYKTEIQRIYANHGIENPGFQAKLVNIEERTVRLFQNMEAIFEDAGSIGTEITDYCKKVRLAAFDDCITEVLENDCPTINDSQDPNPLPFIKCMLPLPSPSPDNRNVNQLNQQTIMDRNAQDFTKKISRYINDIKNHINETDRDKLDSDMLAKMISMALDDGYKEAFNLFFLNLNVILKNPCAINVFIYSVADIFLEWSYSRDASDLIRAKYIIKDMDETIENRESDFKVCGLIKDLASERIKTPDAASEAYRILYGYETMAEGSIQARATDEHETQRKIKMHRNYFRLVERPEAEITDPHEGFVFVSKKIEDVSKNHKSLLCENNVEYSLSGENELEIEGDKLMHPGDFCFKVSAKTSLFSFLVI